MELDFKKNEVRMAEVIGLLGDEATALRSVGHTELAESVERKKKKIERKLRNFEQEKVGSKK